MGNRRLGDLEEMGESQHGYITRAQAQGLGVSDVDLVRLAQRGDLRRIDHGIYKFRGTPDFRWEPVWVAWLRLNPHDTTFERTRKPTEIVAGRTAAWIYDLGDLDPEPYEFVVPERRQTKRRDVRLRKESIDKSEWEVVDGIPVTRPNRLIKDLFAQHVDQGHIVDIAADAFRKGLITRSELSTIPQLATSLTADANVITNP